MSEESINAGNTSPEASVDEIRQMQDRSQTAALIQTVLSGEPSSDTWTSALETLRWLEDYRSVAPLREYLEDGDRPDDARLCVGQALASFDQTTTSPQRRTWWASGDSPLRDFSLRLMEEPEADIVAAVASEDDHPLQRVAISTLSIGFEREEHQALKIRCLGSEREDVQREAVRGIIWDEPLAAQTKLQSLLTCRSLEVETLAADALQYYPSLAALRSLRRRTTQDGGGALDEQVALSIESIESSIECELNHSHPEAQKRLARWAEAIGFEASNPTPAVTRHAHSTTKRAYPPEGIESLLDTTVGSFLEKQTALRSIDWSTVVSSEQARLASRLSTHPDPDVRSLSTTALATWNAKDQLLALAQDEHAVVRKSAMFALGKVGADTSVASFAISQLDALAGTAAAEALSTFAHHCEQGHRRDVLFHLAVADHRVTVRHAAIELLANSDMAAELKRLLPLLRQPPDVNWAAHTALLNSRVATMADRKDLHFLVEVDNVHPAAAAARALG